MIYLHLKLFFYHTWNVTEIGVFINQTCLYVIDSVQPLPVIWHANIRLAEISLEAGLWREDFLFKDVMGSLPNSWNYWIAIIWIADNSNFNVI